MPVLPVAFRPRTLQSTLLAGVSALTLVTAGVPAEAGNILVAGLGTSAAASTTASAVANAQQAAAAAQQAMSSLARATWAAGRRSCDLPGV